MLGPFEIIFGSLWNHFGVDWDHFGIKLGSCWDHFGVSLGSFWDQFGIILGSIWDHCDIILGSFWGQFGIILGSSGNHFGQILTGILVKPGNREAQSNRVRVRLTGSGYYPLPSGKPATVRNWRSQRKNRAGRTGTGFQVLEPELEPIQIQN